MHAQHALMTQQKLSKGVTLHLCSSACLFTD